MERRGASQARPPQYTEKLANSRSELLEQLLAQDPANKLARYGLAMEYVKEGAWDRAVETFRAVIKDDPGYAAAYYHGGQTLEKMGKLDEAREIYRQGIAHTSDPHARGELEAALAILGE
jgi:tetratricopeptide (TPR) repeat protein